MSEAQTTIQVLGDAVTGGIDTVDGALNLTLGEAYEAQFGEPLPAALAEYGELDLNDLLEQGGISAESILSQAVAAIGMIVAATTAGIPVVGWIAAAAILVANLFCAGKQWNNNWNDAKESNRKVLAAIRECVTLLGYDVPPDIREETGTSTVVGPYWSGPDQYAAAWWYLRLLEVALIQSSMYFDEAKGGKFRVGTAFDVVTSRFSGGNWQKLNEGYPYIRFIDAAEGSAGRLFLASGSDVRHSEYARGIFHCSTTSSRAGFWNTIVDFFAGADRKVKRRMKALEVGATAMVETMRGLPSIAARRWFAANWILNADTQYAPRGCLFSNNCPDDLGAWRNGIASPTLHPDGDMTLRVTLAGEQNSTPRLPGLRSVYGATLVLPYHLQGHQAQLSVTETGTGNPVSTEQRLRVKPEQPIAIFAQVGGALGVVPGPVVLAYFGAPMDLGVSFDRRFVDALASARGIEPYPDTIATVLPDDHEGTIWLRAVAGQLRVYGWTGTGKGYVPHTPIWAQTRAIVERLRSSGVDIGRWIDTAGPDRARDDSGGIGVAGLLAAAGAIYLATRE